MVKQFRQNQAAPYERIFYVGQVALPALSLKGVRVQPAIFYHTRLKKRCSQNQTAPYERIFVTTQPARELPHHHSKSATRANQPE